MPYLSPHLLSFGYLRQEEPLCCQVHVTDAMAFTLEMEVSESLGFFYNLTSNIAPHLFQAHLLLLQYC